MSVEMKILFCCSCPLLKELGTAKILLELAEELQKLGCYCRVVSPADMEAANGKISVNYATSLRDYLLAHASGYDVVDYDHGHLPFPRSDFARETLFVARSVLLSHHFARIKIPTGDFWRDKLRRPLIGLRESTKMAARIQQAHETLKQADLINVLNKNDRETLIDSGLSSRKIVVIPHGLTQMQSQMLHGVSPDAPQDPCVVTIATFDPRKGSLDLPLIFSQIQKAVPSTRFKLIGSRRSATKVLSCFSRKLRAAIEVIAEYRQDELPALLSPCSVGIFPSYIEGFGLGVLEMMAASVPVIAYDSPGPTMMLGTESLVPRGHAFAMAAKVAELLLDGESLAKARRTAKQRSLGFNLQEVAGQTQRAYLEHRD